MPETYVHGYHLREQERLRDQAGTLVELLHWDTAYPRGSRVLMVDGIREPAIAAGLIAPRTFDAGVRDLYRTTEPDGAFCYTFFKGVGEKRRGRPRASGDCGNAVS